MSFEKWKRPQTLSFPLVYSKFEQNGETFRIVDIPEDRYEEACEFMLKHFVPYEPKLVSRNGKDDPAVLEDYFNLYMHGIKQKVSVACMKDSTNDFIGISILEVLGYNDATFNLSTKSKTCADIIEAVDYVLEQADLFNRHNVNYYLSGTGLAIDAFYRGRGIATEMIKARVSMLQRLDLQLTSTGFASIGAQKAAEKAGCKVDYQISYKELAEMKSNWNFVGTDTECYVQSSIKLAHN